MCDTGWYYIAPNLGVIYARFTLPRHLQWRESDLLVGLQWCEAQFGGEDARWCRKSWAIVIYDEYDAMAFRLRFC